jgi:hypothetical protein
MCSLQVQNDTTPSIRYASVRLRSDPIASLKATTLMTFALIAVGVELFGLACGVALAKAAGTDRL